MQTRLPLSVAIITLNEEHNLPRCLASVADLATAIVVIDSGSNDKTGEIARQAGAVFEFHQWPGYVAQKNVALRRCTQPWVLSLDADETLSPELAEAIRQLFATGTPNVTGYFVNRRSWYLGQWIWHAWYPEWRLRLVRKDNAEWHGAAVHEDLRVAGTTARLQGDLLHYPFDSLQDHLQNMLKYARLAADSYAQTGKRFRPRYLLASPWVSFFKHLVLKQGWRDGWRGWMIAFVTMFGTFAKYAFLLENQLTASKSRS